MKKFKKILRRFLLALVIFLPVAAVAHYFIFPQETRSILINYSNFKKEGQLYFNAATPQHSIDSLQLLIAEASARVEIFWGQQTANPRFIYCGSDDDFKKYSSAPNAPAVTYVKLGAVIVLSSSAIDLDIIAHEISHAELYERVGFFTFNYTIPAWFKHGLAMQNDYRVYYSEDTLKVKTDYYKNLPDIKRFTSDAQFYSGTHEEVMLHYMAAKHEVKNWYTKEKLDKLIKAITAGRSFEAAYGQ